MYTYVDTARQLSMIWGVYPVVIERPDGPFDLKEELVKACKKINEKSFCDSTNDLITLTAGLPFGVPGTTNVLRVVSAAGPTFWWDDQNPGKIKEYKQEIEM
jgi:pyruvate kinase